MRDVMSRGSVLWTYAICVFTIGLLLTTSAAWGQVGADEVDEAKIETINLEDLEFVLEGHDVPRFHLIRHFYLIAGSSIEIGGSSHADFLATLGILPNSPAERIFTRAVAHASVLEHGEEGPSVERSQEIEDSPLGPSPTEHVVVRGRGSQVPRSARLDDKQTLADMKARDKALAEGLARVHFEMIFDLQRLGVSTVGIERYLINEIAANTKVFSDEPYDKLDLEAPAVAFDREMLRLKSNGSQK